MKMYRPVYIRPHHAGFELFDAVRGDELYEGPIPEDAFGRHADYYDLGKDTLPEGDWDIRGRIYYEPDVLFLAIDPHDGASYYVGFDAVEVARWPA